MEDALERAKEASRLWFPAGSSFRPEGGAQLASGGPQGVNKMTRVAPWTPSMSCSPEAHAVRTRSSKNRRRVSQSHGAALARVLSLRKLTKHALYGGLSHDSVLRDSR